MHVLDLVHRFEDRLARDPRLAAAMERLPAAVGTADWPMAERAARAASNAAVRRALWRAVRGMSRPLRGAPGAVVAHGAGAPVQPKPLP